MELKEKLVASFMAFENKGNIDLDSKVHEIRTEAMATFEKQGFPKPEDYPAPDERVPGGIRPNFSVTLPGMDHSRNNS